LEGDRAPDLDARDLFVGAPWALRAVEEAAAVLDVPSAYPSLAILGACSAAWADRVQVTLSQGRAPCASAIYALIVCSSGGGKSAAIGAATGWLAARADWESRVWEISMPHRVAQERAAKRRLLQVERAGESDDRIAAAHLAHSRAKAAILGGKHRILSDVTPARLAQVICDGVRHPVIIDPELESLRRAMSGRDPDLGVYKSAWSREAIRRDRTTGKEEARVNTPCLTLLAGVQTDRLRSMKSDQIAALVGEGMLARMLVCATPDRVGHRAPPGASPEMSQMRSLGRRIEEVAVALQMSGRTVLQLDSEATDCWARACEHFDGLVRRWGEHQSWLTRGAEHTGRLAALLHLLEWGPWGIQQPITGSTMRRAFAAIDGWAWPSTRAIAAMLSEDWGVESRIGLARAIMCRLAQRGRETVSFSEVSRCCAQARAANKNGVLGAMLLLEDRGWVRAVKWRQRGRDRIPSMWEIHPEARGGVRDVASD